MTVRDFAEHLGVGPRTVSKWEAAGSAHRPRPELQAALDTVLARATPDQAERFLAQAGEADASPLVAGRSPPDAARAVTDVTGPDVWRARGPADTPQASPLPADILAPTSWARRTFDAVIDPAGAARSAALDVDNHADPHAALGSNRLRVLTSRVTVALLGSRYSYLARWVPILIGRVELAAMRADGDESDRFETLGVLSDAYAVASWSLIKADSAMGAWVAAQRAITAAEQADDPLRQAAAIRCLAETFMRAGQFDSASRTALLAAVLLDGTLSRDPVAWTLRGAALLSAAAAAARRGDDREANAALAAARDCGARLGEDRCDLGTVFGPTNVAIHDVAVAVELGDASAGADRAQSVDLTRLPAQLAERRARFLIDVARAHVALADGDAAMDALLQAESTAPEETRTHRLTHQVVRRLLVGQTHTADVRALADRCAVLA
jgi:transcriptional regulator with XRE-family HTH domain